MTMSISDIPKQIIFKDENISEKHTDKMFYLRLQTDENLIKCIDLDGVCSVLAAKRMAEELGYNPTHWGIPGSLITKL